ncbi:MAG: c-type cytochrome [Woeseiaceae bacterium]|nr:c-type cytochrome [Woeseiaceae bacterium]
MNKLSFSALLCVLLAAGPAKADSLVDGSADAGKAKSVTCAACHGAEGNSVKPTWPNLAGQHAGYIVEQLQAFKDGLRNNALMNGQAMMLSEEDMNNLAVYYESLDAAAQPVADPDLIPRGEALYRGGDKDRDIAACIACHGPKGRGVAAAAYPALNGQHATYTAQTLRDYASGARQSGGKEQVMQNIASRLTEDDIVAVASYVQGLR